MSTAAAPGPKGNPIIERLKGKGRIQQLTGYVGTGAGGTIELYSDLGLGSCLELDAKDVLHVENPEKATEPSLLFVREDAAIVVRTSTSAKELAAMGEEEGCQCPPAGEDELPGQIAMMISEGLGASGKSKSCRRNKSCKDKCMKKSPFVRQGCMDSCDVAYPCAAGFGGSGGIIMF